MIYSDEDKLDLAGVRCDPYFKPDWSPDYFLTCMYTCHFMVIRRSVLNGVGGFRAGYEGAQDYDLLLRIMDRTAKIRHIPRVLYHWRKLPQSTATAGQAKPWALDAGRLALEDYVRRNSVDAEVGPGGLPGVYRIKRRIGGTPLVSIVIPTAGRLRTVRGRQVDMLAGAIRSVVERTVYDRYELIVVADADGVPPETMRALQGTPHQVLRFERLGLFNFSAKVNAGVAAASGEHVLLFNDDLEVTSADWLTALLEYSQEPGVGAVGAKLLYPDGRLQHVGMVLGVAGVAAHAFHQHPGVSPGYAGSTLMVAQLLGRDRRLPDVAAGGLQRGRRLRRALSDRLQRRRLLPAPAAGRLPHRVHAVGAAVPSRVGELRRAPAGPRVVGEMRRRWGAAIDRDPYYNPNLTRDFPDYRLDA